VTFATAQDTGCILAHSHDGGPSYLHDLSCCRRRAGGCSGHGPAAADTRGAAGRHPRPYRCPGASLSRPIHPTIISNLACTASGNARMRSAIQPNSCSCKKPGCCSTLHARCVKHLRSVAGSTGQRWRRWRSTHSVVCFLESETTSNMVLRRCTTGPAGAGGAGAARGHEPAAPHSRAGPPRRRQAHLRGCAGSPQLQHPAWAPAFAVLQTISRLLTRSQPSLRVSHR